MHIPSQTPPARKRDGRRYRAGPETFKICPPPTLKIVPPPMPHSPLKGGLQTAAHIGPRGKLGNGEHLSFEAYKYKENIVYVIIIMLHKEHINFYRETHIYRHNCCRFEVMTHKRRWRRSAITCIAGGKCERIYRPMCNGCVRLPNFDLLIISLFYGKNSFCFILIYN